MPRWFEVEPNVFGDVPLGEVVGGVVVLLLSPRTRRARSTLLVCAIAAIFRMWLLDRIGRRRGVDHKLCVQTDPPTAQHTGVLQNCRV